MSPKSYKIIGTPFSTFTRTITLGLNYKNIPFEQVATLPQSDIAKASHPYGYLPTLIIEDIAGGHEVKLSETQAIVRYLDRIAPDPSLHYRPSTNEEGLEERMWEVVSLAASFGFPTVEVGVVKPHLKALEEGVSEADIVQNNRNEVSKIAQFLAIVEERALHGSMFLFGSHPTWADFYLYPLLADLRALPEWKDAASGRFVKWMENMDKLDAVGQTFKGTLGDIHDR
ncbi:hypothetical protein D9611_012036 [Ephemerocybe angulata]|uniref:Glutathione S-transferase n=1 Tax=Ephemerocybe angulata TaxID=980116 RepID=A0A8H5ASS3_9AGAR|nr:hypothetical protein D9611_012036 [Tulosesus angulatus]